MDKHRTFTIARLNSTLPPTGYVDPGGGHYGLQPKDLEPRRREGSQETGLVTSRSSLQEN